MRIAVILIRIRNQVRICAPKLSLTLELYLGIMAEAMLIRIALGGCMRKTNLLVLGIAFFNVLLPVSAFAGQVAYNYSGLSFEFDQSPQWEISGSFILDETDLIEGENLIDKIVSWEFRWTNGIDEYSLSSATGAVINDDPNSYVDTDGLPVFKVDGSGQITVLAFEALEALGNRNTVVAFYALGDGIGFGITFGPDLCCTGGPGAFTGPTLVLEYVDVDIKPSSDTSCNAVIPVAVLGSETFDATLIDASTLSFVGASARQTGNGTLSCNVSDVNDDGHMDLLCQYKDATAEGAVTGELYDGTAIRGSDIYCVSP